ISSQKRDIPLRVQASIFCVRILSGIQCRKAASITPPAKAGTEALRRKSGGVHALPHVRIDAVMSATDAFYRAFDVEKGDCMYVGPEERVGLW
ncbi:MAG: M13-type metalloendopeptidase, partial [Acutalibacteraceae bacterium]|nr:M13-type metalloendopeptidase [Acutalibacteraceae bacterium]